MGILIVDDESMITMQLSKRLSLMGYEVVGTAVSGVEAVNKAGQLKPDLILMDILMPGELDGITAAEIIRKKYQIPVVFMTAHTEDVLVDRAKRVGPLGYIVKPFRSSEIKAVIDVALFRKEMDRQLVENERRYQMAAAAGKVGIWDWDVESNEIYIETVLLRMLGRDNHRQRYQLEDWLSWVHNDDVDGFRQHLLDHLQGRSKVFEVERRLYHEDGTIRWFLARGQLVCDDQGKPIRILGTDTDITDRKLMEEELKTSRERFRNLVEASRDLIWELNENLEFTYMSPQVREMLGYRSEEVLGKSPLELMPPDQGELMKTHFEEAVKGHVPVASFVNVYLHKSGREVVVECNGRAIFDSNGRFLGYRGISRDITERKRMEDALQQSHKDLERRVEERTKELQKAAAELRKKQEELTVQRLEVEKMNQQLTETNMVLSLLAKNIAKSREEAEQRIGYAIRSKVLPIVQKLRGFKVDPEWQTELEILESYIQDIVTGLESGKEITSRISAGELKVAMLIKRGYSSREIAEKLGISVDTVKTHRKNIRKKLSLQNSRINLTTYLRAKLK